MKREAKKVIKTIDFEYINKAAEIIRSDLKKNFTISELALEVFINTFKLREGFKQVFGMTVYQYQSWARLEMAREMLEDTDLPIEMIADKTGFGCRNSFTRRFRQVFHKSPREWRQDPGMVAEGVASGICEVVPLCEN